MFGIVTIAIGDKSLLENKRCITSIRNTLENKITPILTLDKQKICSTLEPNDYCHRTDTQLSRIAKVNLINLIPDNWEYCLYLDSDTRVMSKDILVILEILKSGYDLVIAPSANNDFWHIEETERNYTYDLLGYIPIQLQAGVFGLTINEKTKEFFLRWSNEYVLYYNQDQAAFIRALYKSNLRIWLMGYPFNSSNGSVIKHLFGNTR